MALVWGPLRLFISPWHADSSNSVETTASENNLSQQDIWGFGQVVVLFLLPLPFLSFAGTSEPPCVLLELLFTLFNVLGPDYFLLQL